MTAYSQVRHGLQPYIQIRCLESNFKAAQRAIVVQCLLSDKNQVDQGSNSPSARTLAE